MNAKIRAVLNHFQKTDPILFSLAKRVDIEQIVSEKTEDYFHSLCHHIIGQQLAGKAASAISDRFNKLFGRERIIPEETIRLTEEAIRNVGTSWSKARSIKDLAQEVVEGTLNLKDLTRLDDWQVVENLTKVKGIGPWTAQMFLMFTLGREDIFSHGDLGLKKAILKLYSLNENTTQDEIEEITKKWSPYRTYACQMLWKYSDI